MDSDPRTPGEDSIEAMLKAGDRQGRKKQRKQSLKLTCELQQETSGRRTLSLQPVLNRLFPVCEKKKKRVRCPKALLSTCHSQSFPSVEGVHILHHSFLQLGPDIGLLPVQSLSFL